MTKLFTYAEAAEAYKIGEEIFLKAKDRGVLKVLDFGGGQLRIREQDIDAWLERLAERA